MSFVTKALKKGIGGLLGVALGGLIGKKKRTIVQPSSVTRDEAQLEAERSEELARRRGARADRETGTGGEPVGGLGRFVTGS